MSSFSSPSLKTLTLSSTPSALSFSHRILKSFFPKSHTFLKKNPPGSLSIKAQTLDFSGSFFERGGFGNDEDPPSTGGVGLATAVEEKEEPQCPPGLRQYETMAVLRPDMSEDERLTLTQKYEEVITFLFSGCCCI